MSMDRLSLNVLKLYESAAFSDVSIFAQGREIQAHKAILAASSKWFAEQFAASAGSNTIELPYKFKVVQALVRFMYFGGVESRDLGPDDALDMLLLSRDLGIEALDDAELDPYIIPRLTPQNSVVVLQHEGLEKFPVLQASVCTFVGDHLLSMLATLEEDLLCIPRHLLAGVLRAACHHVSNDADAERVVKFCLQHSQLDSACDLLRETKQWIWGSQSLSILRSQSPQEFEEGDEWVVHGLRSAMESTPSRTVVGTFFDWSIRLDYGAEGKLRIVYESATPREDGPRCINRFPAAMFAWSVYYRKQDVFNEKPVFICFPENASLHWSTTLPVSAAELTDDDDLKIQVYMAENPMLSLVLYYFSADLKTTVFSEDILNRLPHIEYRCLSSYSLVKTHVQGSA